MQLMVEGNRPTNNKPTSDYLLLGMLGICLVSERFTSISDVISNVSICTKIYKNVKYFEWIWSINFTDKKTSYIKPHFGFVHKWNQTTSNNDLSLK